MKFKKQFYFLYSLAAFYSQKTTARINPLVTEIDKTLSLNLEDADKEKISQITNTVAEEIISSSKCSDPEQRIGLKNLTVYDFIYLAFTDKTKDKTFEKNWSQSLYQVTKKIKNLENHKNKLKQTTVRSIDEDEIKERLKLQEEEESERFDLATSLSRALLKSTVKDVCDVIYENMKPDISKIEPEDILMLSSSHFKSLTKPFPLCVAINFLAPFHLAKIQNPRKFFPLLKIWTETLLSLSEKSLLWAALKVDPCRVQKFCNEYSGKLLTEKRLWARLHSVCENINYSCPYISRPVTPEDVFSDLFDTNPANKFYTDIMIKSALKGYKGIATAYKLALLRMPKESFLPEELMKAWEEQYLKYENFYHTEERKKDHRDFYYYVKDLLTYRRDKS